MPLALVLARRGAREVRWTPAHFYPVTDRWGRARKRARARCFLFDRETGRAEVLFEGPARPAFLRRQAGRIAGFLGITEAEAGLIAPKFTADFD